VIDIGDDQDPLVILPARETGGTTLITEFLVAVVTDFARVEDPVATGDTIICCGITAVGTGITVQQVIYKAITVVIHAVALLNAQACASRVIRFWIGVVPGTVTVRIFGFGGVFWKDIGLVRLAVPIDILVAAVPYPIEVEIELQRIPVAGTVVCIVSHPVAFGIFPLFGILGEGIAIVTDSIAITIGPFRRILGKEVLIVWDPITVAIVITGVPDSVLVYICLVGIGQSWTIVRVVSRPIKVAICPLTRVVGEEVSIVPHAIEIAVSPFIWIGGIRIPRIEDPVAVQIRIANVSHPVLIEVLLEGVLGVGTVVKEVGVAVVVVVGIAQVSLSIAISILLHGVHLLRTVVTVVANEVAVAIGPFGGVFGKSIFGVRDAVLVTIYRRRNGIRIRIRHSHPDVRVGIR